MIPSDNAATLSSSEGVYTSVDELLRLRFYAQNLTLKPQKRSSAIIDGGARSRYRGRGMEFAEVRPYQPGDDIRTIDWRVTARTQQPYTKLFQEEKERPVIVLVDQRPSMFFGSQRVFKSVAAAQIASIIGWAAQQNNDRIGGIIINEHGQTDLRARQGKHAVLALIHQLHYANTQLSSPLTKAHPAHHFSDRLEDLRRIARPGSAVFILSDFMDFDERSIELLTLLGRHTDTRLLHFYDPLEVSLPSNISLSLGDGHESIKTYGSQDFVAHMQTLFNERQTQLRQTARLMQATYAAVDIAQDLQTLLHEIFEPQRRGLSGSSMASGRR